MECRDAQFYLRLRRHAADELGPDVTAALDGHMAVCAACAADARAAASFDRAVSSAMRAVPVPAGLHDRLVSHVAGKQGAILRRKAYRVGSLVAASVLVVFIGLGVFSATRPRVDTDALVRAADEQVEQPEKYTQNWLAEQKLPDRLPWDFNYDLLVACSHERIGGRYVPVVTFRAPAGGGFAKVYLFRAGGELDTKTMQDAQASHFRAQVLIGQDTFRGVHYVIVYTGPPNQGLRPFLRTQSGLAA